MWFKNLVLYRLDGWNITRDRLESSLIRHAFQRCGKMEMESRGWISPKGEGGPLAFALERQWLVALGVEQKLLPASVIRQHVRERAQSLESAQGFQPSRRQLRELKEQVTDELLPRAFTRGRVTHGWIDPQAGWLVVDAAGAPRADEFLQVLRRSVDDLPVALLETSMSPLAAMTRWLAADDPPSGFTIDKDCELRSPDDGKATVRFVRHNLEPKDIRGHLESGKQVTRLALTWQGRLSFVLHENLLVKRLDFLDLLKERSAENAESGDERFDAEFAIMTGELGRFLPELVDALDGEVRARKVN